MSEGDKVTVEEITRAMHAIAYLKGIADTTPETKNSELSDDFVIISKILRVFAKSMDNKK